MKNILIIQTAFLGDAILTLPMIQILKNELPESEISVISIPGTKEIFLNSDSVSNVIVYDKKGKDKSILRFIKFLLKIRKLGFTKIISPHRSFRSTLIALISGSKDTTSFNISSFSFFYKNRIFYDRNVHEVQRNISLVKKTDDWKIFPEITIDDSIKDKVKRLLSENKIKKFIVIAPGSVWNTKKYPLEYYEILIKKLLKKDYKIILIGSYSEKKECKSIENNFSNELINLAGKLTIIESIELLKHCEFIICNDSAPSHMAMVAKVPAITIYCSTVPRFGFYPYNDKSKTISIDLECKPCGIHGHKECPQKHFDCGYKLNPDLVMNEIEFFFD